MPDSLIRTADEITRRLARRGARHATGVELGVGRADRHRPDERQLPGRLLAGEGGEGETVVVKLASTDETSRGTGVGLGVYLREVTFYREPRDRIGGPLADCHLAVHDEGEGWFTLVLEDIDGRGAGRSDRRLHARAGARLAMIALARIHAPVLSDLALARRGWLNQPNPLNQARAERPPARLPRALRRAGRARARRGLERFVECVDAWDADRRRRSGSSTATTGSTTCCSATAA